ncbi:MULTISPECIES: hypothetical protein [unclassified Devosia]|uniref:hypothetical protein n=1 Tax=unclassified Devosia TaxID=196773 RepID=UPI00086ED91D|nr:MULTISPECIES: hypothetical protein [unclassified Devosia]MBN9365384.1 hypothetical protein [Devosia sp.]ODS85108.1 MAG: hypothetical protein ABS47_17720 [Devosia sp. SCN 66-27]OJX20326.1 MAG: hypothetical protein BGO83_04870 [Devosia sp. 66-14]
MRTTLNTAPAKDTQINLVIPSEMKRRLFDAAAAKGISASQLVREGIALATSAVKVGSDEGRA